MTTTTRFNSYLMGNFAPVSEEITVDNLEIKGELPRDLSGMYVRNGPNPQFTPLGKYDWMDGDGMLHGVRISGGKAEYKNRYVRTGGFEVERDLGYAVWSGRLEPPQVCNPYGPYKNVSNSSVSYHNGKLLSFWEAGLPYAVKVPSLETIGPYLCDGYLDSTFTSHPKVDPMTGELIFFGYALDAPPYLKYGVISSHGELLQIVPINIPVPSGPHDFAITKNYTILIDLPLRFRPERVEKGLPGWIFEKGVPSRFGILPRYGNNEDIQWFEAHPCYINHILNAYEDGDEVILYACRMSSTHSYASNFRDRDPDENIPRMYGWAFNLKTGAVREGMLDKRPSEFPSINHRFVGREMRYGYTSRMASLQPLFDGIIKYDFYTGRSITHDFQEQCYGGSVTFAPRIGAIDEDDGWLLTFVYDEKDKRSELLVIDAQNMREDPVARVMLPQRVPYGFHGTWISEMQLINRVC
ncbi:MAG: 9-cis-epoxycarotenoid dioxygenase [Okeania sp. SIO2C9]|uniref:carotenoid oxygenase family protein n=1 Tax=Okeania sp. SIO2C9 TaxID=2607791 RepID=UPI0013C26EAF|nr:carotenoid oxygenase family protein [Okeania sp. SIO2C9]NEQ74354.1 9-cis-epoxycarotenoid dioxygenase [Okeania sp. SIO2C9]